MTSLLAVITTVLVQDMLFTRSHGLQISLITDAGAESSSTFVCSSPVCTGPLQWFRNNECVAEAKINDRGPSFRSQVPERYSGNCSSSSKRQIRRQILTCALTVTNLSTKDDGSKWKCYCVRYKVFSNIITLAWWVQWRTSGVPEKPRIDMYPSSSIREGESITVICRLTSSGNLSISTLLRNGVSYPITGASVTIRNLTKLNNGDTFTCETRNKFRNIARTSETVVLSVKYPPILNVSAPVTVNKNQNITLSCCIVSSNPKKVTLWKWFHITEDGTARELKGSQVGQALLLRIPSVGFWDSGMYTCQAANGVSVKNGKLYQEANVSVSIQGSPVIQNIEVPDLYVYQHDNVSITMKLYSNPPATVTKWSHREQNTVYSRFEENIVSGVYLMNIDGRNITVSGESTTLTVKNARQEDEGSYVLTVCNDIDCTTSTVQLNVLQPETLQKSSGGDLTMDLIAGSVGVVVGLGVIVSLAVAVKCHREKYNKSKSSKTGNRNVGSGDKQQGTDDYDRLNDIRPNAVYSTVHIPAQEDDYAAAL